MGSELTLKEKKQTTNTFKSMFSPMSAEFSVYRMPKAYMSAQLEQASWASMLLGSGRQTQPLTTSYTSFQSLYNFPISQTSSFF